MDTNNVSASQPARALDLASNLCVTAQGQSDIDELLHQAAVNEEFRAELILQPEAYGLSPLDVRRIPEPVQKPDDSFTRVMIEGLDWEMQAQTPRCAATCVSGKTILCDGATFEM